MTPRQYVKKHRDEWTSEWSQLFDMFLDFCEKEMCYDCPNCPFYEEWFSGSWKDCACEDDDYFQNDAFEEFCDHDFTKLDEKDGGEK